MEDICYSNYILHILNIYHVSKKMLFYFKLNTKLLLSLVVFQIKNIEAKRGPSFIKIVWQS